VTGWQYLLARFAPVVMLAAATSPRLLLLAIVCASIVVRLALVHAGGVGYWPDEISPPGFTESVTEGGLWSALSRYAVYSVRDPGYHFVLRLVWIVPNTIAFFTGFSRAPIYFFGLLSVSHIILVWGISRRLGATAVQAASAATLLAASVTFFYFARHMLPYDLSMTFALGSLYVGVAPAAAPRHSLASGGLSALAFLTYAGYWTMVVVVFLVHVTDATVVRRDAARRALYFGAGALAALGVVEAAFLSVMGVSLLWTFFAYADRINQGTFDEGWRLPFEYLWSADRLVVAVWALGFVSAVWSAARHRSSPLVRYGLLGLLTIYIVLAVFSTILERFVVYGRLARQLVPFLCLLAGHEIGRAYELHRPHRLLTAVAITAFAAQTIVNFYQPFRVTFPQEFKDAYASRVAGLREDQYLWVNAEHIYPAPKQQRLPDEYRVVAEARHPLQFEPYRFEGYTPSERAALRHGDLTMRLAVREGSR
jgi:hypothetical protein